MLTLTAATLSKHTLLLGSRISEQKDRPVLVCINWLNEGNWQDEKSIINIRKRLKLADSDIHLVNQNSLSTENQTEALLLAAIAQLKQYEAGTRQIFDLPLDTSTGTPFQQKVWQALQQIPYGETISYAQLASNIGQPTAHRAVANANGKNPFSIIIACHRVITSDGSMGGYTGGIDKKAYLLQLERAS